MQLTIIMSSRGNPAFREHPNDEMSPPIIIAVAGWQAARAAGDASIAQ